MVLMTVNISNGSQVQQIESMCHNLSAAKNNKIIQVFRGVYTLSYSFTVLLTTNTTPLSPLLDGCILHLQYTYNTGMGPESHVLVLRQMSKASLD